jgi:cystathionine gamma-lyase
MSDDAGPGPSTRAVGAGLPAAAQGEPFLPGPVLASSFHWSGEAAPAAYARDHHPTVALLEDALGALDGGESVVFASGNAATAALLDGLEPGQRLVAPVDGYPAVRQWAAERLEPRGVRCELVASSTDAFVAAAPGADLVWVETPSNPRLDVVDVAAVAAARTGLLVVDNTVCTPLGQQPLTLGADVAMCSGTKALTGHSDLLLGVLSVRDTELAARLRTRRSRSGSVPGAFEAWLAHRSLPTLALRLERQSANAAAVAALLRARGIADVVHPGVGPLVGFTLASAQAAQRFLAACTLVAEATSFGGVHSTAERRGRWGTDAVGEGFVRFSCGIEDTADLVADVARALDAPPNVDTGRV